MILCRSRRDLQEDKRNAGSSKGTVAHRTPYCQTHRPTPQRLCSRPPLRTCNTAWPVAGTCLICNCEGRACRQAPNATLLHCAAVHHAPRRGKAAPTGLGSKLSAPHMIVYSARPTTVNVLCLNSEKSSINCPSNARCNSEARIGSVYRFIPAPTDWA